MTAYQAVIRSCPTSLNSCPNSHVSSVNKNVFPNLPKPTNKSHLWLLSILSFVLNKNQTSRRLWSVIFRTRRTASTTCRTSSPEETNLFSSLEKDSQNRKEAECSAKSQEELPHCSGKKRNPCKFLHLTTKNFISRSDSTTANFSIKWFGVWTWW